MGLLLALRILGGITILSFLVILNKKKDIGIFNYIPVGLTIIFELLFAIYHPIVGVIAILTFLILAVYFFNTADKDKFSCFFERVLLYFVLGVFCISILFEIVEIFTGRLF